jgi:condensin complex subunit 2
MAPARSSRARVAKNYAEDNRSDSGADTEVDENPQRSKGNGVRRRVSDYNDDAGNTSFTSDNGRLPLKSVNLNDDAAEKRKRRKSAKIVLPVEIGREESQAGPSDENGQGQPPARSLQRLQSVSQIPEAMVQAESLDVMSSNFEEWMKMATDNVRHVPS